MQFTKAQLSLVLTVSAAAVSNSSFTLLQLVGLVILLLPRIAIAQRNFATFTANATHQSREACAVSANSETTKECNTRSYKAESWIQSGLQVAAISLQVGMITGELNDEDGIAGSSDGRGIAYTEVQPNLVGNFNKVSLRLIDGARLNAPQEIAENRTPSFLVTFSPKFSPDGRALAYLTKDEGETKETDRSTPNGSAIVIRNLATGEKTSISPATIPANVWGNNFVSVGVHSFAWSPDGERLAVLATGNTGAQPIAGIEISAHDFYSANQETAPTRLAIYDLETRKWQVISPANLNVDSFDWSPDGKKFVIAASVGQEKFMPYMYTDLYIIDIATGKAQEIVAQPGVDNTPHWSPDGRWIAFKSQKGQVRWLGLARIGLYEVTTQRLSYPAFDEIGRISGWSVKAFQWAPDSSSLLIRLPYHLTRQLFTLSIPEGHLTKITPDDDKSYYAAEYVENGKSIIFVRSSFLEPSEIFKSRIDHFEPQQLTNSNLDLQLPNVEVRQVSWPSRDRRWTIHGWLLVPRNKENSPRPLLVYAEGGPSMVEPRFRIGGWHYPVHSFLANGVAVLIPNSRGRAGYGADFEAAWQTERDCGQGPLEDDLDGVTAMVKSGIADPDRIALAGHSWGGYLAAYALTHTDRFKAIFVHEGININAVEAGFSIAGNTDQVDFANQLGMGVAFSGTELRRLENLSPIYQVPRARTPGLLEYGAQSLLKEGAELFQGLQYFHVPSELISYPRTGHVTEEPGLLYDAARRDLEWFGYWVLGKPTQRMLDRYGPPPISEWQP